VQSLTQKEIPSSGVNHLAGVGAGSNIEKFDQDPQNQLRNVNLEEKEVLIHTLYCIG